MAEERLGRYLLQEVIGQGAMGMVFRAHDPLLDRVVAIKTIRVDLTRADRKDFEKRFQREAQSAGRLSHPSIVTVYDAGEISNTAYIAMEYLQGQDLRDLIRKEDKLTPAQIADIAAQIADALEYAHQHGVVHRDIKPGNIMVQADGKAKLMDFGIARMQTSSMTQTGMVIGTPKYMSPELVIGQEVDGRADIYSLGVVLYQMLTGVAPFEGETVSTTMYHVINDPAPHPSTFGIEIGPGFSYILNRALAKKPQDRYAHAGELAHDLRHIEALDRAPPKMKVLGLGKAVKINGAAPKSTGRPVSSESTLIEKTIRQALSFTHRRTRQRQLAAVVVLIAIGIGAWQFFAPAKNAPEAAQQAASTPVAEPAAPVSREPGRINLAVMPWGEIVVDGKSMGVTPPLNQITLPPGERKIEIRNGNSPAFSQTITVAPGETRTIRHQF